MNAQDKHTPGPWRVVERPEQGTSNGRRVTVDSPSGIVADVDWNAPATNRANAELIRRAPTLFAEVNRLLAERDALRAELAAALDALKERTAQRDKLRAALMEIGERGRVPGYESAGALLLRLVGSQTIARTALRD